MSISLTIIPPRSFNVYMIWFGVAYYLNLSQIAEKQTRVDSAYERWSRQNLVYTQYIRARLHKIRSELKPV